MVAAVRHAVPAFLAAIILAIIYDILNGYNDGGSIIGTLVSAPFLSPVRIVLFVCFFEICGIGMIYYIGLHITRNLMALSILPVTPAIVLAAIPAMAATGNGRPTIRRSSAT